MRTDHFCAGNWPAVNAITWLMILAWHGHRLHLPQTRLASRLTHIPRMANCTAWKSVRYLKAMPIFALEFNCMLQFLSSILIDVRTILHTMLEQCFLWREDQFALRRIRKAVEFELYGFWLLDLQIEIAKMAIAEQADAGKADILLARAGQLSQLEIDLKTKTALIGWCLGGDADEVSQWLHNRI